MKKQIITGMFALALVLGITTQTYAFSFADVTSKLAELKATVASINQNLTGTALTSLSSVQKANLDTLNLQVQNLEKTITTQPEVVSTTASVQPQSIVSTQPTIVPVADTQPVVTKPTLSSNLSLGMQTPDVSLLQQTLKDKGYFTGTVTGLFGPKTLEAVKTFQNINGITPTGYVGPKTRNVLLEINNTNSSSLVLGTLTTIPDSKKWLLICSDGMPHIQVLSPNGGETYTAGQQVTVTWRSCNIAATDTVDVRVIYTGVQGGAITASIQTQNSSGTQVLILPTVPVLSSFNMQTGLHYEAEVMKITNGIATTILDDSDYLFTINNNVATPQTCLGNMVQHLDSLYPTAYHTDLSGNLTSKIVIPLIVSHNAGIQTTNTFTVTDLFMLNQYTNCNVRITNLNVTLSGVNKNNILNITLNNIKLYKLDSNGNKVLITSIPNPIALSSGGMNSSFNTNFNIAIPNEVLSSIKNTNLVHHIEFILEADVAAPSMPQNFIVHSTIIPTLFFTSQTTTIPNIFPSVLVGPDMYFDNN